ncbi:MAG: ferritin family protein [Firmicutes bacterium]|nr:ferritin family protein [Bacillota bacterium]MDD4264746.1 ferritin family protein [Bacillota bacterium]MDD4692778.1 ferritin family protein [Bacillota bacterium]
MKEQIPEAISKAFEFERNGAKFYLETAAKTQNRLARQLLNNLAKEEVQHVLDIDEIYYELKEGTLPEKMDQDSKNSIESSIQTFFKKVNKGTLKEDIDDLEALKVAMDMEKKGYEMYRTAMKAATEPNMQEFFNRLAQEEQEHLIALENVYYYLTNPADWFAQTESQVWNWMNS